MTTLFKINLDAGERKLKLLNKLKLLKQTQVKNFQAGHYRSKQLWIATFDGGEMLVSLVYRKDLFKLGCNPLLVYGYSSYGSSMDPDFSASRLSLLDRSFVFVLTHIRVKTNLTNSGTRTANYLIR